MADGRSETVVPLRSERESEVDLAIVSATCHFVVL